MRIGKPVIVELNAPAITKYKAILNRLFSSEFLKNVSTQMIGTGLAQALPFLATPILTRLYTQDDFARYTTFFAVASILAVAAGGRYFLAVVLPKKEEDAIRLYNLSIYVSIIYALVLALVFQVLYWTDVNRSEEIVYFVPLYVLFSGLWMSLIHISVRDKSFRINALAKIFQASGYIATAIALGLTRISALGLVIAKTAGIFGSALYLFNRLRVRGFTWRWQAYKEVALRYIDFPKYNVGPALLNTLTAQAFILVLTEFYSTEDLGYYGLTFMVLSAPLGLIGTSYKDVFYQRITELINQERFKESLMFFRRSAAFLFALGFLIAIVLYFFGPKLFGIVFGSDWTRSGEFAAILSFSFMVKLVASPLSSVFYAADKIRVASVWQILYFISTFTTLGIGVYSLQFDIIQLLYLYLAHEIVLYAIYFGLQYRMISRLRTVKQR